MNKKILIVQTAFLGDVILTLPMIQVLKQSMPDSEIDFLCIPATSLLLKNNPLINEIIPYNKRTSGVNGFLELIKRLRNKHYDILISPHRSIRSSLISYFSSSKKTISFDTSSLGFLYNERVSYVKDIHEIQRDLKLLEPLGIKEDKIVRPMIFISEQDKRKVDSIFYEYKIKADEKFIVIAPGSVWFTKRFPEEKFVKLCDLMNNMGNKIFLVGGKEDKKFSDFIANNSRNRSFINVTGSLSILESAELIRRAALIVTNDSAPLHIANAVGTNAITIYGATIPGFGFYPYGNNDVIFETNGLKCRPCSIHGGKKCPIGTFVCMKNIDEEKIASEIRKRIY